MIGRAPRTPDEIVTEVSRIDANPSGRIVSFDSEEVFRQPIAYLCEVGFMELSTSKRVTCASTSSAEVS